MAKAANMATNERALNGWSKDHIQHLLMVSDKAVMRGLLQIYARQTESEQRAGSTSIDNGVGFAGADGEFLSNIAEKLKRYANGCLTEGQMRAVRPKMLKYWRQLLEIAATCATGPTFPQPAPQPKRKKKNE